MKRGRVQRRRRIRMMDPPYFGPALAGPEGAGLPAYFFSSGSLEMFVSRLGASYAIRRSDVPHVTLTRDSLPAKPTVLVLPGF